MTHRQITQRWRRAAGRPRPVFCSGSIVAVMLAGLAAPDAAWAGELIAHASVSLTVDEVRDVYLGEQRYAGNLRRTNVRLALAQEGVSRRPRGTGAAAQ
jgi:hypothetical protein